MAFAATSNSVPDLAWVLLLANVCWAIAYDTEYAMVDRDDDLKIGLRSSAITFGRFDVLAVMICYALSLLLLACAGQMAHLGYLYYLGLLVAAGVALRHYFLIRQRDKTRCFQAFLHNNWFGLAVFVGLVVHYSFI
jgi:4-hydroxybenzoate polyprenyltransferase